MPNDGADPGYQYIAPNLTLPCDGVVTKWKIGIENSNNGRVYLQIWQPNGTDYHRVDESLYTHSTGGTIAEVSTSMTVSAGDVVGFFIPNDNQLRLRVAWASVPGHTILQGMRSDNGEIPVATFSDIHAAFSSSPLVSIGFGKYVIVCCTRVSHIICRNPLLI